MNRTAFIRAVRCPVMVGCLAVVVALSAFFAPTVSAQTSPGPETRVRDFSAPAPAVVAAEQPEPLTAVGVSAVRLRLFVSATGVATNTGIGRSALKLTDDVATQIDDAIARASQGQVRFPGHDGKVYLNRDGLLPARGDYTEWTAAASGAKRGADRVIIAGNPASPDAIYYWDHVNPPVRIGP